MSKKEINKGRKEGSEDTSVCYLFPLDHLLVEVVRERPQGAELPRALGTREDAVLVDQAAAADGYQGNAMATETLVQVHVSSLDLVAHRDGPAGQRRPS